MSTMPAKAVEPFFPEIDFARAPVANLYEMIDDLRDKGVRVAPVRFGGNIAWMLIQHPDVYAAYRDEEHFPCHEAYKRHSEPQMGRILFVLQGEEHRRKRILVLKELMPAKVRTYVERLMIPLADELISRFKGRHDVDLVAEYTQLFPLKLTCRLLGIPDTAENQLVEWVHQLFQTADYEAGQRAKREVTAFLLPIIQERRANPRDDLISLLVTAEFEGTKMDDEDVLAFARLIFPAGSDTSYLAMGSMMNHVLGDEKLKAQILADPEIIPKVVEESLRLFGTVTLQPRYTVSGYDGLGVSIPPDSWVLFGNGPASRDPDVFKDPHKFDLDRSNSAKMTFGGGAHVCLGMHLAKASLALSLEHLLKRLVGLKLASGEMSPLTGGTLRGVRSLPVYFDNVDGGQV